MTATVAPVRGASARPVPDWATEVKPRLRLPASEPAAVTLGVRVSVRAVLPAATVPAPATAILALPEVVVTARPSW